MSSVTFQVAPGPVRTGNEQAARSTTRQQIIRARILASDPHFYLAQQYHNRTTARACGADPVTHRGFDFAHLNIGPVVAKILNGVKRADNRQDKLVAVIGELLGNHCRVADLKSGTLYVKLANPALHIELRRYLPAMKAAFRVKEVRFR